MTRSAVLNTIFCVPVLLWFAAVTVAAVVSDVRQRKIPNRLVLSALAGIPALLTLTILGTVLAGAGAAAEQWFQSLMRGLGGLVVLAGGHLLLAIRGGLGGGDAKLAGVIGLVLGCFGGWGTVLLGTLLAWGAGGVGGVACAVLQRANGRHDPHTSRDPQELPFAPFLLGGAWIALLVSR